MTILYDFILKESLSIQKCWGYEKNCPPELRMRAPSCPEDSRGWYVIKY